MKYVALFKNKVNYNEDKVFLTIYYKNLIDLNAHTSTCRFGPKMWDMMLLSMSHAAKLWPTLSTSIIFSLLHISLNMLMWELICEIPASRIVSVEDVKYLNARFNPSRSNWTGESIGSFTALHMKSVNNFKKCPDT